MSLKKSRQGMIIVALIFTICIIIGLVSVVNIFFNKIPLSVTRLKRFQAINYAEAALYETFNRFRTGYAGWTPDPWASPQTMVIDGVPVEVNVQFDATANKLRVSATINESDFSL
ncbi:MAG: hypothetical protein PHV77_01150 [Candidatus Omnitrophica bacterium]|jgi:hypothetical protein|nr:hypothetical protein [Candidatus Omnitrophota bacterium]